MRREYLFSIVLNHFSCFMLLISPMRLSSEQKSRGNMEADLHFCKMSIWYV